MSRRVKELRCFCRSEPLLGNFGIDSKGKLYVHVKVYKQNRIYGELVFQSGVVKIRCRNCLRWHRVVFKEQTAILAEDQAPEVESDANGRSVLDAYNHD